MGRSFYISRFMILSTNCMSAGWYKAIDSNKDTLATNWAGGTDDLPYVVSPNFDCGFVIVDTHDSISVTISEEYQYITTSTKTDRYTHSKCPQTSKLFAHSCPNSDGHEEIPTTHNHSNKIQPETVVSLLEHTIQFQLPQAVTYHCTMVHDQMKRKPCLP